jgi:uncharacterized protein with GYD domain
MPVFVLMTRLNTKILTDASKRRTKGKKWLKTVNAACPEVKWLAHYALLGPYDSMDIYEAPDVETAHRVSLISRTEGAETAESWPAIQYDQFLEILEEIKP